MSLSLKRITKLVTRLRPASQHDLASSLCRYEDGTVQAGDRPAPGGLPVELILQVISHLDRTELLVLCVTSKQFYAAVYPRLYTTIYLKHGTVCHKTETNQAPIQFIWLGSAQFCDIIQTSKQQVLVDQQQLQLLCRSLQIKHISNTVTEFRFEFRSCGGAIKSRWGFKPSPIPPCLCDKMDSLLGQALTSLVNLQVLHLNCMCCINRPTKKSTRHAFLGTLPKNRLQSLWLRCWCVPSDILGQLLATPGVQGVTVLRWESYSVRPVQSILASDRPDLPDLSKLMCNDVALFSPLISRGTLTHLICDADDKDLHNLISRNHGHLVHLRVPILQDILIGMQRHQAPYRNISHLGCVQFLMSNVSPSIHSFIDVNDTLKFPACRDVCGHESARKPSKTRINRDNQTVSLSRCI
jgi:hypothetical protein